MKPIYPVFTRPRLLFIASLVIIMSVADDGPGQQLDVRGQVSGWGVSNPKQASQLGLRYIPDLLTGVYWDKYTLDANFSLNIYGGVQVQHDRDTTHTFDDFDAYRLWLRFATSQFELRAGLQRIEFGSAILLRSLMWFDSIDPRDPLQITEGVWGLLGRYYFLNNANIWLWILYGNDQNRGWDFFAPDKNHPEFGGRIQAPVLTGELALTYHHRRINVQDSPVGNFLSRKPQISENRLAIDGKWDIEVGVWGEAVLIYRDLDFEMFNYQRHTSLGADYTFDWGNGLYAVAEYFQFTLAQKPFAGGEGAEISALSLNYPFGLSDELTAIVYYEFDNDGWYRFIRWQRTYDNWRFFLMGFWNSDQFQLFPGTSQNNLYSGKGIQLLVVFNH